jgi:threonine aldolase
MRRAMAEAEVGDDVFYEDPSVNELQRRAAELLGKEAALYVPSGTMANLLAFMTQTRPGDTILLHGDAHPYHYESANVALFGGLLTRLLPGEQGKYTVETMEENIVITPNHHCSNTTLASIENTTNRGGGSFYTAEEVADLAAVAHEHGLKFHCDGARLFNAVIATGTPASEYARHCDTVSFCLSKGLGAPVGSLLTGTAETVDAAHRFRKALGGGMRQAGILAAAGLHALDAHIEDLAEDHRRARAFRDALEADGVRFALPSPTNILFLELDDAPGVAARLKEQGVLVLATGPRRIRILFHRDISDTDLVEAIVIFKRELLK